jgi:hypothetical protein
MLDLTPCTDDSMPEIALAYLSEMYKCELLPSSKIMTKIYRCKKCLSLRILDTITADKIKGVTLCSGCMEESMEHDYNREITVEEYIKHIIKSKKPDVFMLLSMLNKDFVGDFIMSITDLSDVIGDNITLYNVAEAFSEEFSGRVVELNYPGLIDKAINSALSIRSNKTH